MDNTDTKKISTDKNQNSNLSVGKLRDPNMILPQSQSQSRTQNNIKTAVGLNPLEMQMKSDPVILRSFNKDLSEAMSKKKESVSVKKVESPKILNTQKISDLPKAPDASQLSFLKKPVVSGNMQYVPKQTDKNKAEQIPPAPISEKTTVKKNTVLIPKIIPPQLKDEKQKQTKIKKFSAEIFPKPPQMLRSSEKDFLKKVSQLKEKEVGQQKHGTYETQELRKNFDKMVHGEYANDKQNSLQKKETPKLIPQQKQPEKQNIKKEDHPVLSKTVINIHVSASDLKKLKAEILDMDNKEKELQTELHNFIEQETTLIKEKSQQEVEKKTAKEQLDNISKQEQKIESVIHKIEQEEKATKTPAERHGIEKRRWIQEEELAKIEKEKWSIGEIYERLAISLKEKEEKLEQIESSKNNTDRKINALLKEKDLKKNKESLGEIEKKKEGIEEAQITLLEDKKSTDKTLALLEDNKQKITKERQETQENEVKAESISEKRIFEEKRQNLEIRQRSIEEQRWDAEQKLKQLMEKIKETNDQYKIEIAKEEGVRKKLQ